MRKLQSTTLFIFLFFCTAQKTTAQYYFYDNNYYDNPLVYEAGASVGIMNCFTDLGGKKGKGKKFIKDLNLGNSQFAGGYILVPLIKML
ncbi:MAG: hypothetical protein WDM90_16615 [Ferruginibacter sp.]